MPPSSILPLLPLPQANFASVEKNSLTAEQKRALIDEADPGLSVRRQCELLGLNRPTYYYEPARRRKRTCG